MTGRIVPLTGDRNAVMDGLATRDGGNIEVFFWSMECEGAPRRKTNG